MKPRIGVTSAPDVHDRRPMDRVNRSYAAAVISGGGLPFDLPTLDPTWAAEVIAALDGLLLTGGGDVDPHCYGEDPAPEVYGVRQERDAWEIALVAAAADQGVPILGVCRGAQLLNVVAGGSLVQELASVTAEPHHVRAREREATHPVNLEPGSMLAAIVGPQPLGVNTLHHQAIDVLGRGVRAVAWAPDGIIEAVESDDGRSIVAVQWHPEMLIDQARHAQLFAWLARAASARRTSLVEDVA